MDNQEMYQQFELQHSGQLFELRQHSTKLVQKLTYFVISAELVACGYILTTASNLIAVENLNYLFLLTACAALFGLFWRFFYNQVFYNNVHDKNGELVSGSLHRLVVKLQWFSYYIYVVLSIAAMLWFVFLGFNYLTSLNLPN